MKTLTKLALVALAIGFAFTACKKTKKTTPIGPLGPNFPYILNTIITPAILDTLEKHGFVVNSGVTPPTISGIYLVSPFVCQYDNSNDYYVGEVIDNYKYQFANQNNSAFTVSVSYEDVTANNNTGSDNSATYISGSSSAFTVFAQIQGVLSGVNYTSLELYTGTISASGIENFQNALYIESKVGDADNSVVAPVGTIRIFNTQGNVAITQSTFFSSPQKSQNLNGKMLKGILSAVKH